MIDDDYWMSQAMSLADEAALQGEVPVGAVVVLDGQIIGAGANASIGRCDPTAHAEIQAIRAACEKIQNYRLSGATLYVTLEPCSMCAGAIVHARIERLVYGALEPKSGVVTSKGHFFEQNFLNHKVESQGGVLALESSEKLSHFFQFRRNRKKALKIESKSANKVKNQLE